MAFKSKKKKNLFNKIFDWRLPFSILVDLLGDTSYAIPIAGEAIDIVVAPITLAWIQFAYNSTPAALFGFFEEITIFDIVPTCTITHFMADYE